MDHGKEKHLKHLYAPPSSTMTVKERGVSDMTVVT